MVKALSLQQPPTPHSDVSSNNVKKKVVYNAQVKETFAAVVENRVDKDQTCQLALVSKDIVVDSGTILESGTLNVLVVIEVVLDPNALIPFQIDYCLVNVKDGVVHYVLWPKEFVLHTAPKKVKAIDCLYGCLGLRIFMKEVLNIIWNCKIVCPLQN
ncbi:hypothetical protein Pyn_02307 [Prunus yedoensis var. nudiflora]|uniref:Uncharacterized protein n=1 Tax=Prunus yedoensis var. nudiflora TaxID=2094558 RepID=A0A314UL64_PRUYE|nr:hypothetical protein Pyn_02307 [Prunus yedoensis var. nudiflora]